MIDVVMTVRASASNIEWQTYAAQDYGASHDLPAGLAEWAILKDHLRQYGLADIRTSVEIGCGGGRLTNAIAADVPDHNALDVSPHRLDQARATPNGGRATFHLVSEPKIPLPDNSCDLGVSTHVFQHIESPAVVNAYFAELFRVLRPGGAMMVHVPTIGAHGTTGEWGEITRRKVKESAKRVVLPVTRLLMKKHITPPWKVDYYRFFSFARLYPYLENMGFTDIELRILPWAGLHSYVLGRKPPRVG